jgi:hypothetical protein
MPCEEDALLRNDHTPVAQKLTELRREVGRVIGQDKALVGKSGEQLERPFLKRVPLHEAPVPVKEDGARALKLRKKTLDHVSR